MKECHAQFGLISTSDNGWRLGMHVRWQWIVWVMLVLLVRPVAAVHPLEDRDSTDWIGPQPVDAKAAGIGRLVPDMSLEQIFGGPVSLHASAGSNGTVVFVRDPECPVSHAYGPRLARYARQYHAEGFNFLVLYMNDMIGPAAIAADAGGFDGPAVFINGDTAEFAKQLGVQSTGDVFVLDADQRLVYRGADDDQRGGLSQPRRQRHPAATSIPTPCRSHSFFRGLPKNNRANHKTAAWISVEPALSDLLVSYPTS